jgi:hypothetical protein
MSAGALGPMPAFRRSSPVGPDVESASSAFEPYYWQVESALAIQSFPCARCGGRTVRRGTSLLSTLQLTHVWHLPQHRARAQGGPTMSAKDIARGAAGVGRSEDGAADQPLLGRKSVLMGMLTSGFVIANAVQPSTADAGTVKPIPIATTQPRKAPRWTPSTAYGLGRHQSTQ